MQPSHSSVGASIPEESVHMASPQIGDGQMTPLDLSIGDVGSPEGKREANLEEVADDRCDIGL